MDMGSWHQLIHTINAPLFKEHISPKLICNSLTNMKLLSRPLVVKADARPGQIAVGGFLPITDDG
jgi:hypothetical protein